MRLQGEAINFVMVRENYYSAVRMSHLHMATLPV